VNLFESCGVDDIVVVGDVDGGIPGGLRRRDSVAAGLAVVPSETDWVLIHDAARPLATPTLVRRVLKVASSTDADGVVPATAVTDTLKEVADSIIVGTVDRSRLAAVQTPQAFRLDALQSAHEANPHIDATDDAALIEQSGGSVVTVPGEPTNVKITFRGDLDIAEMILERRTHE